MNVGVVDIGTNTMRLLITSSDGELGRWVEVTGLGREVDRTGRLSETAIRRTLETFERFGALMLSNGVDSRKAIATSACRDAVNAEDFFDRAEPVLRIRPVLISGSEEGRYAFRGAVGDHEAPDDLVVSDIGGGSSEFVTEADMISIDIGSVRLTERALSVDPPSPGDVARARLMVLDLFQSVGMSADSVVGVAGTWTSLAAMAQDLDRYDPRRVHGFVLEKKRVSAMIGELSGLTLRQKESIPSLDPSRAPVILGGAIVAESVLVHLGLDGAKVSERDTLDGVAEELLAIR